NIRLFIRAAKGSYIDNLYIGNEAPVVSSSVVDLDFASKTDLNGFTTMALSGWTGDNGKYHPVDAGVRYNASATKYNEVLDLTGKKYISFDFYVSEKPFDVALLDASASNIWGNSLTVHIPNENGDFSVTDNIDVGNWKGGVSNNLMDEKSHTLEIFINNGKISYKVDGVTPALDTGATEFDAPSNTAYLVFRAVGVDSYIDNLYIGENAPQGKGLDFDGVMDGNEFISWNSAGWGVSQDCFAALGSWATTQYKYAFDLTKNQEITFDVFLSSTDTDKQFNIGFYAEEDLPTANTSLNGKTYSLGETLYLSKSFGRRDWIADVATKLYNDTWHSVKISVQERKLSIAVDGVAYDALTTDIPMETAYMLLQSTSTANLLDNFKITMEGTDIPPVEPPVVATYTVTFKNWNGAVLQTGLVEENETPSYTGEIPTKTSNAEYAYEFDGWDKEIVAVTGDMEYVAKFKETKLPLQVFDGLNLDFSDEAQLEEFFAYGESVGWKVEDGVFKPNAAWASVNTGKVIDLTKNQQITLDVYLSSAEKDDVNRQFNVGFFASSVDYTANTQENSGVCYSLGSTMFWGSSFSRVHWVADVMANLYDDSVHSVKIIVKN
ncbi:MAG: hypothetical protein IKZ28_04050, partial [Clostridia bacterium]|nr:hypothetical protein [Clostridia bacterium]